SAWQLDKLGHWPPASRVPLNFRLTWPAGYCESRFGLAGGDRATICAPMSAIRPWRTIERRKSRQILVGSVAVGGDAPVTVQTMTNTPTSDAKATIDQIRRC